MNYSPIDFGLSIGHQYGHEVTVICPFHNDRSPSATFNTKTGLFYCFVCKLGLNAWSLAKRLDIKYDIEAEPTPLATSGVPLGDDFEWRQSFFGAKSAKRSVYLKSRGVTPEQIEQFDIRENDDGIIFPLFNAKGSLVGTQTRYKSRSTPRYRTQGVKPPVWPMSVFPPTEGQIILAEGIFGALNLRRAGLNGFATMGSGIPKKSWLTLAPFGSRITTIFDNDSAGQAGALRIAQTTGALTVWPGAEVDELDADELQVLVEKGRPFSDLLKREAKRWVEKASV